MALITKEPDLIATLAILQKIVDAWESPMDGIGYQANQRWQERLNYEIQQAAWHLFNVHRCEFMTENGVACDKKAEREVFGLKCCERHAQIRETSIV